MLLYLIRHGETSWNADKKVQGRTDIPLNETGTRQARLLRSAMKDRPVSAIFSSPLKRAWQTAQILAEGSSLPVIPVQELREVEFGLWEGKTWEEIQRAYPQDFALWDQNPVSHAPTGGESRTDCRKRCERGMEKILKEAEGSAAIVAHGGILVFVADYLLRCQKEKNEIIVKNASITTIQYDRVKGVGELLQLNDVRHLS